MKVHPLRSISAKLFVLTTFLVMLTAGAISFENIRTLKTSLSQQMRDLLTNSSENAGSKVESLIRGWDGGIRLVLRTLLTSNIDVEAQRSQLQEFLEADHNLVHFEVYKMPVDGKLQRMVSQFSSQTGSNFFEGKDPKAIEEKIKINTARWLSIESQKNKKNYFFIKSISSDIEEDMLTIVRGGLDTQNKIIYWAALTIWKNPINEALNEASSLAYEQLILNKDLTVFVSSDKDEKKSTQSYKGVQLLENISSPNTRQGFSAGYFGPEQTEWVGSFYRIPTYDLIIIIQREKSAVYAEVIFSLKKAVLLGALFVLIAIFFSYFGAIGLTKNIRLITKVTQRIASGDFSSLIRPKTRDEVGILTMSVNSMAMQIQNLIKSHIEKTRVEKELETAQAVQATIFPRGTKATGPLRISGFSRPASECGGDWWGHYQAGEGVEYVFVADAMGHGVPAALVTAMAYSCCATLVASINAEGGVSVSPKDLLDRFNRVLYNAVEGSISMTFFVLRVDYVNMKITFSNAGHNFPILLPVDPNDSRIRSKIKGLQKISDITPISLVVSGTILGVEKDAIFKEKEMPLKRGDKIFLFSDGLIECTNEKKEAWGRKKMLEFLLKHINKPADLLLKSLVNDAFRHFNNYPLDDDLTAVVVEFSADAEVTASPRPESLKNAMPPMPPPPHAVQAAHQTHPLPLVAAAYPAAESAEGRETAREPISANAPTANVNEDFNFGVTDELPPAHVIPAFPPSAVGKAETATDTNLASGFNLELNSESRSPSVPPSAFTAAPVNEPVPYFESNQDFSDLGSSHEFSLEEDSAMGSTESSVDLFSSLDLWDSKPDSSSCEPKASGTDELRFDLGVDVDQLINIFDNDMTADRDIRGLDAQSLQGVGCPPPPPRREDRGPLCSDGPVVAGPTKPMQHIPKPPIPTNQASLNVQSNSGEPYRAKTEEDDGIIVLGRKKFG